MKYLKPEDYSRFEAFAEPQISPNKLYVLYTKRIANEEKYSTALFIVNMRNSKENKQITQFSCNAKHARWSPCGSYIAYISAMEKSNELCIFNTHNEKTIKLALEKSISSAPSWSYDSKKIVFTTVDNSSNKLPSYDGSPLYDDNHQAKGIRVINDIDYKFDGIGFMESSKNEISTVLLGDQFDEKSLKLETICSENGNFSSPIYNKNGDTIYAVLQHKDKEKFLLEYSLVEIVNKKIKKLFTNKGTIFQLLLSPSGLELSFLAIGSDELYYESKLYIYTLKNRQTDINSIENITISLGRNIGEQPMSDVRFSSATPKYQWLNNNKGFTALYVDKGASVIAEIYRDNNPEKRVFFNNKTSISAFSKVDESLVVLLGKSNATESLFEIQNNKPNLLVKSNDWLDQYDLGIATKFVYKGAEYKDIDGWYITPHGYDMKAPLPTLLMIHGGPQGIFGFSFMFWAQVFLANGYAVVYTNPRGSLSYGIDFALEVIEDWGNRDFHDILKGLEYAIDLGICDKDKLGITGWSYGGYMTNLAISKTHLFKAAVSCASVTNIYSMYGTCDKGYNFIERQLDANPWDNAMKLLQFSPINYAKKIKTPLLLIHGEKDMRCPISQSEELYTALKRLRQKVVLVRYKDQSHGFTNVLHITDFLKRSIAWMNYYIRNFKKI